MRINKEYAVMMLIEILFEKGLVNEATYKNTLQYQKSQCNGSNSHISQAA